MERDRQRHAEDRADGELVHEASRGDRLAIGELLDRHLGAVRVFVRLNLGAQWRQRESCSDIVQSVCLELLENLDRFEYRGETQFRHWLCKAARNKIRQHDRYHDADMRAAARETADGEARIAGVYGSLFSPSQQAMANETWQRLEAAFDKLPEDYRDVILLCRVTGLTHEEAAHRMGRTVDSVRNLLHRAIARLATHADVDGRASTRP